MAPTIREIVRYFRDYPDAEREFKRNSGGRGPRAWVAWHIETMAKPAGKPVWREPMPARLWHYMRETMIRDDHMLLARMSPEYPVPQRTFADARTPQAEAERKLIMARIEAIRAKQPAERTRDEAQLLADWTKQHGSK